MPGSSSSNLAAKPGPLDQPLDLTVHALPGPPELEAAQRTARGRLKMFFVLLICAAPVIASYFTYYVVRPEGRRNFGELIEPQRSLPMLAAASPDGKPVPLSELTGQWLLVSVAGGACQAACENHLYLQRQMREALGKDKDRLDWVWLVDDAAPLRPRTATRAGGRHGAARAARATGAVAAAGSGAWAGGSPLCGRSDGELDDALPGRPGPPGRGQGQVRPGAPVAGLGQLGPSGAYPMTELVDLAPALHMMAAGAVLAAGPLGWLWLRNRQASPVHRLALLTGLTLFLTLDLVVFGAFTRLTDSGLGCPDWPGCYASASPAGAHAQISAAQAEMPTGPVTHTKAWIEMVHRYLATGVGVLILTLAVATWMLRRREHLPVGPWWPTATLVWVCIQGAFGALTVTMKLFPAIVTLHLLGGLVLLALLVRQAVGYRQAERAGGRMPLAGTTYALLLATSAAVWLQAALGGWVSTNYAVLACQQFPICQGSWWPAMDFAQGFELWRPLGLTAGGEHVSFSALTAIHYVHRLAAYIVLALLLVLAWRLRPALPRQARLLGALALWQLLSGLSNVVLGWPLLAALAHTGGAALLVMVLTWAVCESRAAGAVVDAPAAALPPREGAPT